MHVLLILQLFTEVLSKDCVKTLKIIASTVTMAIKNEGVLVCVMQLSVQPCVTF